MKVDRYNYYRLNGLNPLAAMLFINSCLSFVNFFFLFGILFAKRCGFGGFVLILRGCITLY